MSEKTIAVLFGGIGGFSAGSIRAKIEYAGQVYKYRLLVSIDCDPVACLNHDIITGEKTSVVMDLFSRKQYVAFHGQEPPPEWREVTPWDIWVAFGRQVPNTVFLSPPCKGLSGLLPEKSAKSAKYQALNELTVRGIELTLKACDVYGGHAPDMIHFENVPRITSRGKHLLSNIKALLKKYGYVVNMNPSHNLGEIGGLGQNRVRFLIMARQERKIPNFIYTPPKKRLRAIGEVIGPLPLPGDTEACGWMHRIPRLQWKTWIRLAIIPAGGDWRDLENIDYTQHFIELVCLEDGSYGVRNCSVGKDLGLKHTPRGGGPLGVQDWDTPSGTVIGNAHVNGSTSASIADPRLTEREGRHPGVYRVVKFNEPGPCVTGTRFGSGAPAIADPRTGFNGSTHTAIYQVRKWDKEASTVTGARRPNNGAISIADPRIGCQSRPNLYGVADWNKSTGAITGSVSVTSSNGVGAVADPRLNCSPRSGMMGIQRWEESANTITSADLHSGCAAVSDPRIPEETESGVWLIIALDGTWHRPLTTFELAMLQTFPMFLPDGRPFQLDDCSDAKAREYIGNAYPSDSAEAISNCTLMTLAKADARIEFELTNETIWVMPDDEGDGADRGDEA